ncbi:MAG: response regulator [Flavobacteriales bacterium]|nr:response regulator [Flavobacteriales bacterium]
MGKLLTIEDDVLLRETLTEILEVYGHTVIQAGDGEEGVELFTKTAPDLVLCDVNMPKMDGFAVLEKLKNLVGASKFPPFIFLSAKTEQKNVQLALDLGAVDFVSKPYSAPELLRLIELRLND